MQSVVPSSTVMFLNLNSILLLHAVFHKCQLISLIYAMYLHFTSSRWHNLSNTHLATFTQDTLGILTRKNIFHWSKKQVIFSWNLYSFDVKSCQKPADLTDLTKNIQVPNESWFCCAHSSEMLVTTYETMQCCHQCTLLKIWEVPDSEELTFLIQIFEVAGE
jgi:hypothetical protein